MYSVENYILAGFMIFVIGLFIASIRREAAIVLYARCSRCRYNVDKLTALTCPECGNDLEGNGTIKPGDATPKNHLSPNVTHVFFALVLGVLLFVVLRLHVPHVASWARFTAASASGVFKSCTVHAFGTRRTQDGPFSTRSSRREYTQFISRSDAGAALFGPGGQVSLEILDDRLRAEYDGPSGKVTTTDAFDDGDILRWMEAARCDVTNPLAAQDASAIAAMIRHAVVGGSDQTPGTGPNSVFFGLKTPQVTIVRRSAWTPWWMYAAAITAGFASWYAMRKAHEFRQKRRRYLTG